MAEKKEISFTEMKPEDWDKLIEIIKECEQGIF